MRKNEKDKELNLPTAIIQARKGSTRLPGKVMLNIRGKPVLWHVVNRVSKTESIDGLVVATTTDLEDDIIAEFCKKNDILVFRGSENDVLDRYYQCAKEYDIKDIVRITSDCPLHDPDVIDRVIKEYLIGDYDYVSNTIEYTFPDGLDVEVFSFDALEKAWNNAKLSSEREHVTPYMRKNEEFMKENVSSSKKYPLYRLTLDYLEDYEFIKRIYEGIGKEMFYIEDIAKFLGKNPELLKMNQHIEMNEGYTASLRADARYMDENNREVAGDEYSQCLIIDGKRIYLRVLNVEDASQEYCNWLNDPIVNKFLETKKTTIIELKEYIEEKKDNPNCLFLGIFLKGTKEHIGNIKLEPIDFENKEATLGILIGTKTYWGRSICTEAVKLLVNYAFKDLNMDRIALGVISENKAAIKCYIKAGFEIDKIEHRTIQHGEKSYDKVIMCIEQSNYEG
jgi:spore coat polysaccharide biosynthesis protein SpsF